MKFDSENELEEHLTGNMNGPEDNYFLDIVTEKYFDFEERQVHLYGYGVIDILRGHFTPFGINIQITELKNVPLNYSAVGQICRYKTALERSAEILKFPLISVSGVLVASEMDRSGDLCFLVNEIDWLEFHEFSISARHGVQFEDSSCGWYSEKEQLEESDSVMKKMVSQYQASGRSHKDNVTPINGGGG